MVVSVPLAACVERDHEEVPAIEILEGGLTAILSSDGIAQSPRHPIQDAGRKEEPAHVVGLALQHFLDEVIDDEAVVASEAGDEAVDIVPPLHGEGSQLERSDPTLRTLLQRGDLARLRDPGRPPD